MLNKAKKIIGIDSTIAYTVIARILQAGGGLVTLSLIVFFLSKEEQGYYYTFGSIVAIQVFFELGLNGIITQYVSHEFVHLEWEDNIKLSGSQEHLSRISSLLHFCFKVFIILALILFLVLIISGFMFFNKFQHTGQVVSWKLPWVLLAFASSLMLIINPICSFLEGMGKILEIS
jgi:O-antigen/teichoic acid export membrane protein